MPKDKRNIGQEILEGIRQLSEANTDAWQKCRRSLASAKQSVCRNLDSPHYLECPCVPFRNGSKVVVHRQAQPEHCCSSRKKILAHSLTLPRV